MQHDFPRAYDLVVVVRPHEPLILAEYQRILSTVMVKLHRAWQERDRASWQSQCTNLTFGTLADWNARVAEWDAAHP